MTGRASPGGRHPRRNEIGQWARENPLEEPTFVRRSVSKAAAAETAADRLHVEFDGDERRSQIVFDGRSCTFHDRVDEVYAVTKVPPGLDSAIDAVFETYGFSVPIADLVYADPYRTLIEGVEAGFLVGLHRVDGVSCHHLAFSQETIDWQIWIEDGPVPVPRKLPITYKESPDSPQYVATLSNWSFQPRLSGHYFDFHPPAGADETEFLPPPEIPEASEEEVEP
jgi:hypothetical protein